MTHIIPQWLSIKERILAEYKKHPSLDWAEIAARKIAEEKWKSNEPKPLAATPPYPTDEELQREAEREYPYPQNLIDKPHLREYFPATDLQRRAYINGRKKSLEHVNK